jgi:hypothetical protein
VSKGTLKKISAMAAALVAFSLLVLLSIQSINKSIKISKLDMSISTELSYKEKRAASASRMSAVRIVSMSADGTGLSSMSGTYLTAMGRYYVLTVMHGIAGPCELTKVMVGDLYYGCIKYITVDSIHDYAIMEVEKIDSRTPISIILDTPSLHPSITTRISVLSNVYYTGFPNTMGPFTVRGHIMGSDAFGSKNIYILSYAWMGASGSGVFNERSKLIGYVIALDVGKTEDGVQVLENVVMVGRSSNIDWSPLFKDFYE